MTEQFIVDDCGTLIDIKTRNTYDYVSEVCPLLNEFANEILNLRAKNTKLKLFFGNIIEDLEKQAKSKEPIIISEEYVKWIKNEVEELK
ncbi:hypothetical protein [Methanobrevibacter sp.]